MRKRQSLVRSTMLAGLGALALCSLKQPAVGEGANSEMNPNLVSANVKFAFHLLSEILKRDSNVNVFVSPASVAIALAMTYNGAAADTQQAMAATLELQGMPLDEVNRAYAVLRTTLAGADPKVELHIANSLWARKGIAFRPDFIARNKEFYAAEVTALDFSDPTAAPTINAWVSDNTKGKIARIVDDRIPRDMVLFLINAVYFKGEWSRPFQKELTEEREFTLLDGTKKMHPMMSQSGSYNYYRGEKFQVVNLPYGRRQISLYVFLPDKDSSLKEFCANLTADNWDAWMSKMRRSEGDLTLPRFKLDYELLLNDALKAMGMDIAFTARADFSAMTPEPVLISQVKHKTYVDVNEQGTEAAAATSVGMALTAAPVGPPPQRFTMVVDRPFFIAIRDNRTGVLLFLGSIVEPK